MPTRLIPKIEGGGDTLKIKRNTAQQSRSDGAPAKMYFRAEINMKKGRAV